jgi:hypothetical protein
MELRDLMMNGFIIFPNNGKFILKKESVPNNEIVINEKEFDSYELAVESAIEILKSPQVLNWEAVVRFNQGLGIEYKNLSTIVAETYEDAQNLAEISAFQTFDKSVNIIEIRVRPKK